MVKTAETSPASPPLAPRLPASVRAALSGLRALGAAALLAASSSHPPLRSHW